MMNILPIFVLFRLLSVILVQTHFVPDEYWQTLEWAHHHIFGYGYLTWEHHAQLRSPVYSSMYSLIFFVLKILHLDSIQALTYVPRIAQATSSAFSDFAFYKFCISHHLKPKWIKIAIFTNWFLFYCSSRTLINTFEENLVSFALFYFKFNFQPKNNALTIFSTIVCFSVFIRPTSGLIWGPFCLCFLLMSPKQFRWVLFYTFLLAGVVTAALCIAFDSYIYDIFVITPWMFLKFNILHNVASFYGSHPFHWYLTQGVPVVLGMLVIPFFIGFASILKNCWQGKAKSQNIDHVNKIFVVTITVTLLIYSLVAHKEFRFILPLSPMMTFIALQPLNSIRCRNQERIVISFFCAAFVTTTIFFGLLHQRGTLKAMDLLASEAAQEPNRTSIVFLMPCHSTPLYSHLHVPVKTKFILCEPPVLANHVDETNEFFENPLEWAEIFWQKEPVAPSHVVLFDNILEPLKLFLEERDYTEWSVIYHTILPYDWVGENVVIYKLQGEALYGQQ